MIWESLRCYLSCPEWYYISRDLFLKIKIIHDEFLYDRVLNSYHSHIYMLSRIGKLLDTLNCLLCIECCQALLTLRSCHCFWIKIEHTPLHSIYTYASHFIPHTYAASTLEVCNLHSISLHPLKNILFLPWE